MSLLLHYHRCDISYVSRLGLTKGDQIGELKFLQLYPVGYPLPLAAHLDHLVDFNNEQQVETCMLVNLAE